MKIRNHEIERFVIFLMELELTGRNSRMRSRLCKQLATRMEQTEQERLDLIKQFSNKDSDGNPLTEVNEQGLTTYSIANMQEFDAEFHDLMNELFIIEKSEENREMFDVVLEATLNTTKVFSGVEAVEYDRWCDIIEGE